ncbi:MAG: hypothetical protein ACYTFA_03865 [Planctomycetota bacterium]|jgi:4-amino-4-deoxy-L-arabinose transferase-like glycosyltransferase
MLFSSMLHRKRTVFLFALLLAVCAGLWFYWLGRVRWMDRDEGMYALAAELVRQGQQPWKDFLYPQSPLYPYLLAPFHSEMVGLRSVSAMLGGLMVGILACFLAYRRTITSAVWACLVLMSCWYVATWIPTVKTQAPAIFLTVVAAVIVAGRASATRCKILVVVGAGVFVGLATLIKVPCFALILPSAAWLVITEPRRLIGVRDSIVLVLVALVVVAAGCWLPGASRDQMLFNLFEYHNHQLEEGWKPHLGVLRFWIMDTHSLLLVAFGLAGGFWRIRTRAPLHRNDQLFAALIAVLFTVAYLLARLPQKQYLAFAAPFWVWAATPLWHRFSARWPLPNWRTVLAMVAWVSLSLFAYWRDITVTPFIRQNCFSTEQVHSVRDYLRENLPAGSEVASIWPGYVVDTGHRPTPGLESGFSFKVSDRLTPDRQRDLHVMGWPELLERIEGGRPDALVFTREDLGRFKIRLDMLEGFYELSFRTDSVLVFIRS